jgi:aminoglycoside phosphotransferase (APT) family kinase protein
LIKLRGSDLVENQIKENISYAKNANRIIELNKGFSTDKKYVLDDKYLLRLFSSVDKQKRKEEFNMINQLSKYSNYVPSGIEFGTLENMKLSYMILTYLPGMDAESALKGLSEHEQYSAGFSAGKELKQLHSLSAPSDYPSWYSLKKHKNDKYLMELKTINLDETIKKLLETYITENEYLMEGRPNMFQHDDFHPSNIVIDYNHFSGIIDFQKMDWGDPIHDLQKLGFFSKRISIEFTKGIIDGYLAEQNLNNSFWELYTFYSAVHIVSALVWGLRRSQEQYELMLEYSLDVINDHDHFRSIVPKWYR